MKTDKIKKNSAKSNKNCKIVMSKIDQKQDGYPCSKNEYKHEIRY